jgi:RND family efflux transporter MFP subunit
MTGWRYGVCLGTAALSYLAWAVWIGAAESAPTDAQAGFLGVLAPSREVKLTPLVEGRLIAVHARIGDTVEPNALVAEIDPMPIQRELDEAEGKLEEARAAESEESTRLVMATDAFQRLAALSADNIVSVKQVREAEQQRKLAQAGLDRARARVQQQVALREQLSAKLAQTRLVAPFGGTLAERYANPGSAVGPGTPIVRIISTDAPWARFAAPATEARGLAVGGAIRITIPGLGVEATGTIRQIGSEVDPASGMIICEGTVEIPPGRQGPLISGQAIRVHPVGLNP